MYRTLLLTGLLLSCLPVFAQKGLDSLWGVWESEAAADTSRAQALYDIIWDGFLYSQPDSAFTLAGILYDFSNRKELPKEAAKALKLKGIFYHNKNEYPKALDFYQKSLEVFESVSDKKEMTGPLNNIGLIYLEQGLYPKALGYLERSLALAEESGYKTGIANAILNVGSIYLNQGDYDNALKYHQQSLAIYEEITDLQGIATCAQNMADIYLSQSEYSKALDYYERSIEIGQRIGDKQRIASAYVSIGRYYYRVGDLARTLQYAQQGFEMFREISDQLGATKAIQWIGFVYRKQGKYALAEKWCLEGLLIAREFGFLPAEREFCNCLYDAYKTMGNTSKALEYNEKVQALDKSLQAQETTRQLQQMEFAKQTLIDSIQKEEEKLKIQIAYEDQVQKKNRTKNIMLVSAILFFMLAGGLFSRNRYITRSRARISEERDRSENLLLNILPAEIAAELKEKGHAEARDFDGVSILFTDFKEFTQTASNMSAKQLVDEINYCFQHFDQIVAKYGVEKIKTIGDAFMAAGGLPVPDAHSTKNTVLAALEMQDFIIKRLEEKRKKNEIAFEMRVGIHTGPVVAGIVGVKKFQYDIWGDTVNIASRMENHGQTGKVNISDATRNLLKDDPEFDFTQREEIEVKGKGMMKMWFVNRK
jgi:adenylate cyclase